MNATERAARRHIAADWHIAPIAPRSKLPATSLVKRGYLDATTCAATVAGWFEAFPEIGIGVALDPSGLLAIGPDCQSWLEEFERRGLPHTAVAESRPGHRIYYYKRPADCPNYRLCKSGEYDIMTNGGAVLPPSTHPDTGEPRRWLVPPWEFDELPEAPAWAVAMLEEAVVTTVSLPPVHLAVDGDDTPPPVRLGEWDQEVWDGKHPARKPDGTVDASETLWAQGMMLARANASTVAIATALGTQDRRLGLNKYSGRRDQGKLEYWRIACKVVDRVEREPAVAPAGSGDTSCPEQLAAARRQIAELQASLANVRAEYGRLHDDLVARHEYWTDPNIAPLLKVVGYSMAKIIAAAPHQPHRVGDAPRTAADPVRLPDHGIAGDTGKGRSTIWRALDELDQRLGTIKLDTRPRPDGKSARYATLADPAVPLALPAILARLRVDAAANPVPEEEKQGGRRVCPDCGRKHVRKIKTTHTYQCRDCGWQETVDEPAVQPCPAAAGDAPEPPLVFQDETPKDVERDGDREPLVFQDETQAPAPTPLFTPAPAIRATDRRQNLRTLRPSTGAERERPHCQAEGCGEFAAAGSAYCAGHTAWEWADQADAEPPPAEPAASALPPQPHAHLLGHHGKRVTTPDGPGILRQPFASRVAVELDSDPGRLRFFAPPDLVQLVAEQAAD